MNEFSLEGQTIIPDAFFEVEDESSLYRLSSAIGEALAQYGVEESCTYGDTLALEWEDKESGIALRVARTVSYTQQNADGEYIAIRYPDPLGIAKSRLKVIEMKDIASDFKVSQVVIGEAAECSHYNENFFLITSGREYARPTDTDIEELGTVLDIAVRSLNKSHG